MLESERSGENFVTRKITLAAGNIAEGLLDHLELGNMDSFHVLLCVDDCGSLVCQRRQMEKENAGTADDGRSLISRECQIEIFKGDCIFVPANSEPYQLHGQMELLRVRC